MATWNNPLDVTTGDNLTATLWNNQLGANGSLKYVYDELTTTQLKRNIVLHKSTNTVFGGAGNTDITFDTIITNYAGQQTNFSVTVPITDIPLPAEGMYIATFQWRYTATTLIRTNFTVDDGVNSYYYVVYTGTAANVLTTHTIMFYAPTSSTIKLNVQANAGGTMAGIAPSSTDGSQVLTIVRI